MAIDGTADLTLLRNDFRLLPSAPSPLIHPAHPSVEPRELTANLNWRMRQEEGRDPDQYQSSPPTSFITPPLSHFISNPTKPAEPNTEKTPGEPTRTCRSPRLVWISSRQEPGDSP